LQRKLLEEFDAEFAAMKPFFSLTLEPQIPEKRVPGPYRAKHPFRESPANGKSLCNAHSPDASVFLRMSVGRTMAVALARLAVFRFAKLPVYSTPGLLK